MVKYSYAYEPYANFEGTYSTGKEKAMKRHQQGTLSDRTMKTRKRVAKVMTTVLVASTIAITVSGQPLFKSAAKEFKYSYSAADNPVITVVEPVTTTAPDFLEVMESVTTTVPDFLEVMETATTAPSQEVTTIEAEPELISTTVEEVDNQPWARRIGTKYRVSKSDFVHLCNLVGREYGADFVPVEEKALVAVTVLNRVQSEHFPNSVEKVITQPGQYEGELSRGYYSAKVTESVREAVMMALNGEITNDYVFYWGDGTRNHFYTYEEYNLFAKDLTDFKAKKAAN